MKMATKQKLQITNFATFTNNFFTDNKFLQIRQHTQVVIDKIVSNQEINNTGIVHGTALWLFLLYVINFLKLNINGNLIWYGRV